MGQERWRAGVQRWARPVGVLAILVLAWLLAAPRGPAPASVALSGPKLGGDAGASGASDAGGGASQRASTGRGGGDGGAAPARVRRVVVHVAGAVRRPGVYRVRAPGRLIDAVRRAGGLLPSADLTQINLAARLTDGRAIIVPSTAAASGADGGSGAAAGAATGTGSAPVGKVSLNTATAEQLDALEGIGPAMAAAIINLRTRLGGFARLDQLDEVPGVGEVRLARLKEQLEL